MFQLFIKVLPLLGAVALIGSNSLSLGPIAPEIALGFGVPVESVLHASSAFGLGTGAGALLLARLIDRLGAIQVMRVSIAILALSFFGCAVVSSPFALTSFQFLAGLVSGVGLPAIYARTAQVSPVGFESRSLGIVLVGWTISLVAGVTIAALVADHLGWRSVYYLLTFSAVVVFIVILFEQEFEPRDPLKVAPSPLNALTIRGVPLLLIVVSFYMASFYASYAFVSDYLVSHLDKPVSKSGLIALTYGLGFGIAVFFDGLIDRLPSRLSMPVSLAGLAAVYLVLSLPLSFIHLLFVCFLWGLANHLALNILVAQLSAIDPDRRGTVLGLYSGATYICMGVAIYVAGIVYPVVGWRGLNILSAALCVFAVVLVIRQPAKVPLIR